MCWRTHQVSNLLESKLLGVDVDRVSAELATSSILYHALEYRTRLIHYTVYNTSVGEAWVDAVFARGPRLLRCQYKHDIAQSTLSTKHNM